MKNRQDASHDDPPAIGRLANTLYDFALASSSHDVRDPSFLGQTGLDGLDTRLVHRQLLAFYVFVVLVLVPPESAGWEPLGEDDQRALIRAVWTRDYDTYMSVGGMTAEQVYSQMAALAAGFDEVYEVYQQARLHDFDPDWQTRVVKELLERFRGGAVPESPHIQFLERRVHELLATFPSLTGAD